MLKLHHPRDGTMSPRPSLPLLALAVALGCAPPPARPFQVRWTDAEGVEVVARVSRKASELVVDDRSLYFCEGPDRIMSVPKAGGPGRLVFERAPVAGKARGLESLAADGEHLYWRDADAGAVQRIPARGGSMEQVHAGPVEQMLVDGPHVYVTERTPEGLSRLLRLPKDGGPPVVMLVALSKPTHLAASSDRIFWVDWHTRPHTVRRGREVVIDVPWGAVQSVAKTGGEPTTFEETWAGVNEIVGGGGRAYFGSGRGRYWVWDPAAGALAPWPIDAFSLRPAIADERGLYSLASGWLCRVTPRSAKPVWLAPKQYDGHSVAADAEYVYWIRTEEVLDQARTYIGRARKR